jgi:hypothetical protein
VTVILVLGLLEAPSRTRLPIHGVALAIMGEVMGVKVVAAGEGRALLLEHELGQPGVHRLLLGVNFMNMNTETHTHEVTS